MGIANIEQMIKKCGNNPRVFKNDGSLTKQGEKTLEQMKEVFSMFTSESGLLSDEYKNNVFSRIDNIINNNKIDTSLNGSLHTTITDKDKEKIYSLYREKGVTQQSLANAYMVSQQRIAYIIKEMKEKNGKKS